MGVSRLGRRALPEMYGDLAGATLESEILSKQQRDCAHSDGPGGSEPVAFGLGRKSRIRLGRALLAAIALTAGTAELGARGAESEPTGQAAVDSGAAAASPQGAPQSSGITLRVTSRETVVDVTVTDAKGQPIQNLRQSDFTVKEDGKPQALQSFQEYKEADTPTAERIPPKLPPNVYNNLQPVPTTDAVNILLLDALNTLPADQMFMKQDSIKYLKSMPRGTRIAVLSLGSSLRILQGFTSDPSILIAVVDSKKNRALPSPFIDNDSAGVLDSQVDSQLEADNADLESDSTAALIQQFENENTVEQQDVRNRMTLEALNQIAAYVAGIKGRKNLIWFTEGMPLNIFPSGGVNDLQGITDYAKDLRKTADLLTTAEVAVYPVDARKLFSNPAAGADQHLTSINARTAAKVATTEGAFQQKKGGELLGMEAVAEATGGAAYYNTNDLKSAVSKAIDNGANYYSLSYVPPDLNFDGRYHAIEVEVNRPGVHLAYRRGYNADDILDNAITPALPLTTTAPEPFGNDMQASMQRGVPTSSQVLFDVRVAPSTEQARPDDPPIFGTLDPKLTDKRLVRYELVYLVPSRQIAFREGPGGTHTCSLEFDLAAYDVFGKRITGLSQTISPRPLTSEQYQQRLKSPFQFLQQLDLPPGEIFLRVGILDAVADKVGTLEIPLKVSKNPAGATGQPGGKGGN